MSTNKRTKINSLLQLLPKGAVATNEWLTENGVSSNLKWRYIKNNWLQSVGSGAVVRAGDQVNWQGGLFAIQTQLKRSIHVGGKTALIGMLLDQLDTGCLIDAVDLVVRNVAV